MDVLRVYKNGSAEYNEITSATLGGFTELSLSSVRNGPGGMSVSLAATTIAMLHSWIDEAARVELWIDGTRHSAYIADKHTPKWGSLTATIDCVGFMIHAKGYNVTIDYDTTSTTLQAAFQALVAQVPEWTWNGAYVSVPGVNALGSYTAASVLTVLQDLAEARSATIWIDADNVFHAELVANATTVQRQLRTAEYPAGQIVEFEPSFTAGKREMKLEIIHDDTLRPGMKVDVLGVGDGRTYTDVIQQVSRTLGDETDELLLGYLPPVLIAQDKPIPSPSDVGQVLATDANGDPQWVDPFDSLPGGGLPDKVLVTDANGDPQWVDKSTIGGGSLPYFGTIASVQGDGTVTVTVGGVNTAGVRYLKSYAPVAGDTILITDTLV